MFKTNYINIEKLLKTIRINEHINKEVGNKNAKYILLVNLNIDITIVM